MRYSKDTFSPVGRKFESFGVDSVDSNREESVVEGTEGDSKMRVLITKPGVGVIDDSASVFSSCSCSVLVMLDRLGGKSC